MPEGKPLQLDLYDILRSRLGRKMRYVPRFMTSWLERLICQDELNDILRGAYPRRGKEFCRWVLDYLDITVEVEGLDNIPRDGRYVFASNHPLGGLDGISLIAVLGERYGDEGIAFPVNDMLMNVEPLTDVFLPINKYGSQGRQAAADITAAYAGDKQIIIFPAGLVSRLHDDGEIRDLRWQKAFVAKALDHNRAIVPVRFEGLNRMRFYKLARRRKKLGVKVNVEQATLPAEVMAARGKHFRIIFGSPIDVSQLRDSGKSPAELADEIRKHVYNLK